MPTFATAAMAEGYAKARPPLHARIVARFGLRAASALDVGCGAGLSTAPLLDLAERVAAIDPFPAMVQWGPRIAPGARFLAARAEALPFRDASFDLIAAAGSLNYADPAEAFPELRRVITTSGTLCVYDFSQNAFPYPRPPDGSRKLDPEILSRAQSSFHVARSEALDFTIEMDRVRYEDYLRTELERVPPLEPWRPGDMIALRFTGYLAFLAPL